MFFCPRCQSRLATFQSPRGVLWECVSCRGRAVNLKLLRRNIEPWALAELWRHTKLDGGRAGAPCPSCRNSMREVDVADAQGDIVTLDICRPCQFVWFDPGEFHQLQTSKERISSVPPPPPDGVSGETAALPPHPAAWKWLPGLMGMPVEREDQSALRAPWLTWLMLSFVLVFGVLGLVFPQTLNQLGLIPDEALRFGGLTFLTSFFVHAGLAHLLGNMYFLAVFGDNVEDYLGGYRYMLLLVISTIGAGLLHVAIDPRSTLPLVGASGGISGILTFYALQFPRARLSLLFFFIKWITFPTWVAFVLWILFQLVVAAGQLGGFTNVSALAHLGGAFVGFLAWLIWRRGF